MDVVYRVSFRAIGPDMGHRPGRSDIFLNCCTEVAVIRVSSRLTCAILSLGLSAAVVASVGGCANNRPTTYGLDSRDDGARFFAQGQYTDAAAAYRNAVRTVPSDFMSYYHLGLCEEKLGAMQQAIQAFKTSLDVMPLTLAGRDRMTTFRFTIMDALARVIANSSDKTSEIEKLTEKAQAGSVESYRILARVYRYGMDPDSAIDAYNRASLLEPRNVSLLKEFGLYLEQLHQNARAEAILRQAYGLDSADIEISDALRRLGVIVGPSIKEQNQLVQPIIPPGPIAPPTRLPGQPRANESTSPPPAPTPTPSESTQTPRE